MYSPWLRSRFRRISREQSGEMMRRLLQLRLRGARIPRLVGGRHVRRRHHVHWARIRRCLIRCRLYTLLLLLLLLESWWQHVNGGGAVRPRVKRWTHRRAVLRVVIAGRRRHRMQWRRTADAVRRRDALQLSAAAGVVVVAVLRWREARHCRLQLEQMQRLLGRFVVIVVDHISTWRTVVAVWQSTPSGHVMMLMWCGRLVAPAVSGWETASTVDVWLCATRGLSHIAAAASAAARGSATAAAAISTCSTVVTDWTTMLVLFQHLLHLAATVLKPYLHLPSRKTINTGSLVEIWHDRY